MKPKLRTISAALLILATTAATGEPGDRIKTLFDRDSSDSRCSITKLESQMDRILSRTSSEVDFSFSVEREDGRRYSFNRGSSTLQTSYESASTSKLVSAVIILRLVEQGYLNLSDRPQDHTQRNRYRARGSQKT